MRFRFTLSHEVLGSLEISEPEGWEESVFKLERDKDYWSLVELFEGGFVFYGSNGVENGGIDFIRQVEDTYGVDADLGILIELAPDDYTFETVFNGLLDLSTIEEFDDNRLQCAIIRESFWTKFMQRKDTPVNIQTSSSVDNDPITVYNSIRLNLTDQIIEKATIYEGSDGDSGSDSGSDTYSYFFQLGLPATRREISESYELPFFETTTPVNVIEVFERGEIAVVSSGQFAFQITASQNIDAVTASVDVRRNSEAWQNIGINSGADGSSTTYEETLPFSGSHTFATIEPGDLIYLRVTLSITLAASGTLTGWAISLYNTLISFTQQSTVDASTAEGFWLHDVAAQIADRIISQNGTFYSELLGSDITLARQYNSVGCGANYALLKGLQIRQYELAEKPFFMSFKQWWDGINPILNLGLGYETFTPGTYGTFIRVEEKSYFFSDLVSVNLSNVLIQRNYDNENHFNVVEIGYKKWQSEDIQGIDDPQTKRTYASRFKKVGVKISLLSEFIAASLAIETTRRMTREKSADYKYDDDTFIIAVNPTPVEISPETSPDVVDYEPELDENFNSVSNLTSSDMRYNLRLTPARNLLRWLNFISGGLFKYTDSYFKFQSGEGNYDMESTMMVASPDCGEDDYNGASLSEKGDIPVSSDRLFIPKLFDITVPMTWEQYKLIANNRHMAIGISQTDENHARFYIQTLEYSPFTSEASIKAWPKDDFEIQVVEDVIQEPVCPTPENLGNYLATDDGFYLLTDDGEYLLPD